MIYVTDSRKVLEDVKEVYKEEAQCKVLSIKEAKDTLGVIPFITAEQEVLGFDINSNMVSDLIDNLLSKELGNSYTIAPFRITIDKALKLNIYDTLLFVDMANSKLQFSKVQLYNDWTLEYFWSGDCFEEKYNHMTIDDIYVKMNSNAVNPSYDGYYCTIK